MNTYTYDIYIYIYIYIYIDILNIYLTMQYLLNW